METHQFIDQEEVPKKRPVFLTVLGILTFINAGAGLLSALISFASGPLSESQMEDYMAAQMPQIEQMRDSGMNGFADTMEKMVYSVKYHHESHIMATSLDFAISALAVIGVIFMFRGDKRGFHMYIVSCLLRVTSFYFYTPPGEVSGFMVGYFVFTSLLFIIMYSRNLKWMNK